MDHEFKKITLDVLSDIQFALSDLDSRIQTLEMDGNNGIGNIDGYHNDIDKNIVKLYIMIENNCSNKRII